jgi:hypothetical protein
MQFVVAFILFFSISKAWAFEYQLDKSSLIHPSILQRYSFREHLSKSGFTSLGDQNFSSAGIRFDGAFVNQTWSQSILLKAGLVAPDSLQGQIIEDVRSKVSAVHITIEGTPYLILAKNFSKQELQSTLRPWLKPQQSFLWTTMINQAYGFETCNKGDKSPFQAIQSTASHIANSEILQEVGQCGLQALQGMKQSGEDTYDFFKKLSTDPVQLWTEMQESFDETKDFLLNINSEIQNLVLALGTVSTQAQVQIACSMTGALILEGAKGGLLSGGLAKMLPFMALKIKKTTAILAELAKFESKGFKMPNKNFLTHEALSCVH